MTRRHPARTASNDPAGRVAVRYRATRLARFRPSPEAQAALRSIDGIDDGDVDWPPEDVTAIADWLDTQQVGTVRVLDTGIFVGIEDPEVNVQLDKHPLVRAAEVQLDPAGRLDTGLIRLGGIRLGRPITQAVGVAARDWMPNALGMPTRRVSPTNRAGRSGRPRMSTSPSPT